MVVQLKLRGLILFLLKLLLATVWMKYVLQACCAFDRYGVPQKSFAPVCVVVDKLDKLPEGEIVEQLSQLGVEIDAIHGILSGIQLDSMSGLEELLGSQSEAIIELKSLFNLAEGYGYSQWLMLDASIVRGLAYYTGNAFSCFEVHIKQYVT